MHDHTSDAQAAWESTCSAAITTDVIWRLDAYRAALFVLHVARGDCQALRNARPDDTIASQLLRAAGSVSANLAEGYSRSTRADRLRFFGYALGSARECLSWYEALRGQFPELAIDERLQLVTRVRALLLGMIRAHRSETPGGRFEP